MKEPKVVRDAVSTDYKITRFGILNADGDFWTPDAFASEEAARTMVRNFWRGQPDKAEQCLRDFRFVPVRVTVSLLNGAAA